MASICRRGLGHCSDDGNGGQTSPKLFNRALARSLYWVKQYNYDDLEAKVKDESVRENSVASYQLRFLRAPDYQTLFNASIGVNSSAAGFDYALRGCLSHFTVDELTEMKLLYPASGTTKNIEYNTNFAQAGLISRDIVLACLGYWLASSVDREWQGKYIVIPAVHPSSQNSHLWTPEIQIDIWRQSFNILRIFGIGQSGSMSTPKLAALAQSTTDN
ncbi:uncharacterized protein BCR38DRAFT_407010 [Pseudomassariella vexata]|uniref:Uncharacterized protein n=1 Tax=Pseudomassariella vexata TaxID=1141098 RepID=A0A1Y2E6C0_9PEZI|nr:uncharacterized protein BCR38DRAFT_407010 [Pseudomassariella vexata]ORY66987.1 hypothetical protein BCR38DRAFT_407010 [Pseudomassariella vexata]